MWRRRSALAAVCCALVVACSPTPTPTTAPPTIPATAPTDVNAQERATLQQGGNVRLRLSALPEQWNPLHPDGDTDDVRSLVAPLTAPAFLTDSAGRATPNPDVVLEADVSGKQATRVTLTLNPDARWGDDAPVTAADWIATWKAMTGRVSGVEPTRTDGWDRVATVSQGGDPFTVVIDYTQTDPAWAEALVPGPLRADSVRDGDAFSWTSFDAGRYAGPWAVSHVDATQGVVTLDPNPSWWGDPVLLDHVIYRTLPDESAPAAFRNNELDVLPVGVSAPTVERLQGDATASLRSAPSTSGRLLKLDTAGLLEDQDLRNAVLMALDPAAVAKADLNGLGATATVWSDPLRLPTQPGYADQAKATGLAHDPDAAAAALDEAGWKRGATGMRERDGEELSLTFAVDDSPWAASEFATVAAELEAVGIAVTEVSDEADLTPITRTGNAFPLAHLPKTAWFDSDLNAYAQQISSEMDLVRQDDQATQLSRLLWQRVDTIPLFQPPDVVAVRTSLANVGSGGFASTSWEDVGWQA